MTTIGLAMIVKDEAEHIGDVLGDVRSFCDELIVVDTGSTDDTVMLAKQAGADVYEFPWTDDFAAARNHAFDLVMSDWILWLDGDDRVPPESQLAFLTLKTGVLSESEIDAVLMPYRLFDAGGIMSMEFSRERLLRREAGLRWEGAVHEAIAVPLGRFLHVEERGIKAWVEHHPGGTESSDRNLVILQRLVESGDRSPRTLFYLANELRDHQLFQEAIGVYHEYLAVAELEWEIYDARVRTAWSYHDLGMWPEAMREAGHALVIDPTRAEAPMMVGMIHYDLQAWGRAYPMFLLAARAVRPKWGFCLDAAYSHLPWDYLSMCCHHLGKPQEAIEAALRAAETSPERDRIFANLATFAQGIPVRR